MFNYILNAIHNTLQPISISDAMLIIATIFGILTILDSIAKAILSGKKREIKEETVARLREYIPLIDALLDENNKQMGKISPPISEETIKLRVERLNLLKERRAIFESMQKNKTQ